jgi:predicted nucleotidyltransferase component of viral defense system
VPPRRKAPTFTERQRHRANPITLRIKQDDYDRAQVLAQLATDLTSDPRIGRSVLFKGGAVLQMGHQSPRFSRDLDATAIARQTIEKGWVEDVLEAHRVGGRHGYVQRYELVEQRTRLLTKSLRCLAISGNQVDLRIEINWSESPIRPAGEQLTIQAVNRDPVQLRVMHRVERAAEKLRAFLDRGFGGDAYDLYFFRAHVLTRPQLEHEIKPMLPIKLSNVPALATHPDLKRRFDDQLSEAENHYRSSNVVISGAPPAWSTVAAALPAWRALLE